MFQLELLWNLQCIDKEIANIKRRMKDKTVYNQLIKIKNEYDAIKVELDRDTKELNLNTKQKNKLDLDLKQFDQKMKEENEKLYTKGTSLKEIEYVQKEIENNKRTIDGTENELLELMGRDEVLINSTSEYKRRLSELKSMFETLKKTYTEEDERDKNEIGGLEKRREDILKRISGSLVNQYNNIAARKSNPVSRVDNGICTECGIKLNAMLYDALKKNDSINVCGHCGRILYIE
jgi:predicted  nucleic acid-binding Zn-ribbon protein